MTDLAEARALLAAGDLAGAAARCIAALGRTAALWEAHYILGLVAERQADKAGAERCFAQAAALARDPASLNNLGIAQLQRRDYDAAIRAYERALAIDPNLAAAANNLGNVYRERGQLEMAERWYRRAGELAPARASIFNNLGVTQRDQGRIAEAIAGFRRALELDPDSVAARANLGAALSQEGRRVEAAQEFRQALRRDPHSELAAAGLLQELAALADWNEAATIGTIVDRMNQAAIAESRRAPEQALHNITRSEDAAENLRVARSHSEAILRKIAWRRAELIPRTRPRTDARLRIGYLSADMSDHPIAHLSAGLFAAHDRTKFAVHVYAYGRADESPYRKQIAATAEHFTDIDGLDTVAAAQRIADDGIDILVEMTGHTSSARLEIPALRPAPVQVHWLGYPGSMGASFLDYLIADRVIVPDADLGFYGEKVLRLPNSYQVNNGAQPIAGAATRADAGLPEQSTVLCCFNQIAKLEPPVFGVWMRLLGEHPDTVLWLLEGHAAASTNLRRAAAAQGIAPERLIFAPKLDKPRHLGRLGLADVALDTRIYNGHTTTSDALYASVPVVTICGSHFASRVSASLLTTQGLEELIASDLDAYYRLATALIGDRQRLAHLRAKTAAARHSRPLFDTRRFTRNLEAAYEAIWSRHKAKLPMQHVNIVEAR
jgi:protein O-GlcNAc transferase